MKNVGLWHNPVYVSRKSELGIFIDDVREVMPNCVVKDVRSRWPNPDGVPYQGHVPTTVDSYVDNIYIIEHCYW